MIGHATNLYDLTVSPDVAVLKGCGLGGTSLINANVALECEPRIYEDRVSFCWYLRDNLIVGWIPTWTLDNHVFKAPLTKSPGGYSIFKVTGVCLDDDRGLSGCANGASAKIGGHPGYSWNGKGVIQVWPRSLREDDKLISVDLERFRDMMKPAPYPDNYLGAGVLPKVAAMEKSATHIADIEGLSNIFSKPPLYVNFNDTKKNHVGVPQPACNNCGNCCAGCNTGAKNTLNMNYIPDAKAYGAEIFTQVEVIRISRDEMSDAWAIHYKYVDQSAFESRECVLRAKVVILGAGSLSSTNIMLESQRNGLDVSTTLGKHFTTNGDAVGFSYNGNVAIRPTGKELPEIRKNPKKGPGPCITSLIDMRNRPGTNLDKSYVLEDGTPPSAVQLPYNRFLLFDDWGVGPASSKEKSRELGRLIDGKAFQNSLAFLGMSNDDFKGELKLDSKNGRVWVDYPKVGKLPDFKEVKKGMQEATTALKGTFKPDPVWEGLVPELRGIKSILSVHPLGGCIMAESGQEGVVNDAGQVFKGDTSELHPDFYVMDGSVIPRCLGVNPTLTISMVSERCMRLMGEQMGWTIDYDSKKQLDFEKVCQSSTVGIKFTERMANKLEIAGDSTHGDFILTIECQDVQKMLTEDEHAAGMHGTVNIPALSDSHFTLSNGYFTLFNKSEKPHTRLMTYRMLLTDNANGKTYFFHGVKTIHKDRPWEIGLHDTTTMDVHLYRGKDDKGELVGHGTFHIKLADFIKQLHSMEVTRASSKLQQLKWKAKFCEFFAGCLWKIYGHLCPPQRSASSEPDASSNGKLPLDNVVPDVHGVTAGDETKLLLTRYNGGTKGPVMLVHGLGTNSQVFVSDALETNLVSCLIAQGYDVWLADWQGSTFLPSHTEKPTLNDSANDDIPALVNKIVEITGKSDVQVLGQGCGSLAVVASLLSGQLPGKIRSMVASQVASFCSRIPDGEATAWKESFESLLKPTNDPTLRNLNLPISFITADKRGVYDRKGMDQSYKRCKDANPDQDYERKTLGAGKDLSRTIFPEFLSFLDKYAEAKKD